MTRRPPKVCTSPNAEALLGEFVQLGLEAHIYALAGKVSVANDNTRWPRGAA
jgi:hypothetical protein